MKIRAGLATLAAVAAVSTAAYAYTIDANGNGFVGKGEVQTLFELNNARMQAAHIGVTFEYDMTTEYGFECEWWTGPAHNRQYHKVHETETLGVMSSVEADSRKTGQWTGWILSGFTGDVDAPAGEPTDADCGGAGKTIVEGTIEVLSTGGGLYAILGGDRRLLP